MKNLFALTLLLVVAAGGCASAPQEDEWGEAEVYDPLEGFNRAIFNLNDNVLDPVLTRPLGVVYNGLPVALKTGIGNFLDNWNEPVNAANGALQGKFHDSGRALARFAVNSTFGVGGLFDFASDAGLEKVDEDFGQTLGYYGVRSAYLYLPLLGPSTIGDASGLAVDGAFFSPSGYLKSGAARGGIAGLRAARARAAFLDAEQVLEGAVLDKYGAVRDIYAERRRALIEDEEEDDF